MKQEDRKVAVTSVTLSTWDSSDGRLDPFLTVAIQANRSVPPWPAQSALAKSITTAATTSPWLARESRMLIGKS